MTLRSIVVLLVASFALAACGGGKGNVPDEFEVVNRAPLVIPPEADLVPPRPGEPRAQEIDPGQQAYDALFPNAKITREAPKSKSELDLLRRMAASDPDIRSNVADKDADVVKKTLLLADILAADERTYKPDNIEIKRVSSTAVK
ncbi:DUF3035 domain-containing protein [Kordiimonas pumila]|uniref:DUF3035 domain-containing protein n=1 Tax=Kordiimonas pumila TaxID=2161677 RepID=A0ABV7D5H0_9PROT|nr:DUF3035 domain-containing protein [Kordiimonas pumila]